MGSVVGSSIRVGIALGGIGVLVGMFVGRRVGLGLVVAVGSEGGTSVGVEEATIVGSDLTVGPDVGTEAVVGSIRGVLVGMAGCSSPQPTRRAPM